MANHFTADIYMQNVLWYNIRKERADIIQIKLSRSVLRFAQTSDGHIIPTHLRCLWYNIRKERADIIQIKLSCSDERMIL